MRAFERKHVTIRVAWLASLVLLLASCASSRPQAGDSESHFLKCTQDAECDELGPDYHCQNRVCVDTAALTDDGASAPEQAPDDGPPGEAGGASGAGSVEPACTWPAYLDTLRPPGSCKPWPYLVACKQRDGSTSVCASDNRTDCSVGISAAVSCEERCEPGEYALVCGAVGPAGSQNADPPDDCRLALPTPGGPLYMCCPCSPD
jgi:hypothetical protein